MACTKTGCHIWLVPYGEFAYGDAFEIEPILAADHKVWRDLQMAKLADKIKNTAYFRLAARSHDPINGRLDVDYIVYDWDNWFNPGLGDQPLERLNPITSMLLTNNFARKTTSILELPR